MAGQLVLVVGPGLSPPLPQMIPRLYTQWPLGHDALTSEEVCGGGGEGETGE